MAHLVEIGLLVVTEAGVGPGYELQPVAAGLHVESDVEGLGVAAVLHGVVEIDDGAEAVVVANLALQFLTLGIGAVEVLAAVGLVVVRDADIGPCRHPVLYDHVGLFQSLAGAVEHLLGLILIDVDLCHPEVWGGGALVGEVAVLVVDGLVELVLGLGEVAQARRHGSQGVGR